MTLRNKHTNEILACEQTLRGTGAGVETQPQSLGEPARRLMKYLQIFTFLNLNR